MCIFCTLAGLGYAEGTPEEGVGDFVTTGGRWRDAGVSSGGFTTTLGASGGVVAWSLAGADLTNNTGQGFFTGSTVDMGTFLPFDYQAELRRAFDAWASVANIEFIQIADGGGNIGNGTMPTIRVVGGFIDGENGSNVLARAFFPSPSAAGGDIVFDNGNTSFFSSVQNFFLTALHEIGHALGLDHESGNVAIMNPFINTALTGLQTDDINGIRAVYGAQDFGPNSYFMPASQTNLTLIDAAPALTIVGNGSNNVIIGSSAAETFLGGAGDDAIDGSGGFDTAIFAGMRASYSITGLGGGNVRVVGLDGIDTLSNIEQIQFSDQTIPWSLLPDLLASLSLAASRATVVISNVGEPAAASTAAVYFSTDSTITTSDTALATFGVPVLSFNTSSTNVISLAFPGNLTPGTYYVGAVSDINGNVVESNESNNVAGAIAIILGNDSANTLNGSSANDMMFGLGGSDRLNGAAGADMLTGGTGADIFVFDATTLANAAADVFDRVTDYNQSGGSFSAAEGDQIDLSGILSAAYNHGNGQPVSSLIRIVVSGSVTKLEVDTDGAANGANWKTIAQLDGLHINDTVNVILDASLPGGSTISVTPAVSAKSFNGDAWSDILWQSDSGTPAVWLMNGVNVLATGPVLPNSDPAWHEIAAADFNADGKSDVLWQNNGGAPAIWLMDGVGVLSAGPALSNPGASWKTKDAADFNRDGKADILWQNDNGAPSVWLMDGVNVLSTGPVLSNPGPSWHTKAAADFNGDGKADILWQNDSGAASVWLMDGVNFLATGPVLPNPGPSWHAIAAADFNGDGKADILWQNDNGTPAVWLMDGVNALATASALSNPGSSWKAKDATDFNGDGRADILWQNTDGTPAVWLMNGVDLLSAGPVLSNPGASWHII